MDEDDWADGPLNSMQEVAASIGLPHPHHATNIVSPVDPDSAFRQVKLLSTISV